ncbi:type 2 periplasmic-binding domain-containing protein [Algiphilus aromaticivorans]|uniref:hypothetical protein n=1 Tax=Algiphilus aromaticivorans TaxID=382454 RepID=UPI000694A5AD|nr:hypothetical protein [Algiphilus aromaticivorans]
MMPRTGWTAILLFMHATLVTAQVPEQDKPAIAVIASTADQDVHLNPTRLSLIYRRKLRFWLDGRRIHPINLPVAHPLRQRFSQIVLGSSPKALEDYWRERYFLGIEPPFVVHSTEAMIRIVAQTKGALGYVDACDVDARVRVLLYVGSNTQRRPCPTARD